MQRYTRAERQFFTVEFNKSGLTQKAFSELHNISKSSLSYWLRKEQTNTSFVNVAHKLSAIAETTGDITLIINNKIAIRVTEKFNETLLKRILHTLGVTI